MDRRIGKGLVVGLLLLACGTGCERVYRCDTVLNEDGSVDRRIEQKEDTLPVALRGQVVWNSYAVGEESLVTAKGHFASVKEIPDHVVLKGADGSEKETRLVRSYERKDYVFVTEHRWKETLPENVTREDLNKAVDDLTEILIGLVDDMFREGLGAHYDALKLVGWLREDGRKWLHELADRYYEDRVKHRQDEETYEAMADICAKYGLVLKEGGKLLDKDAMEPVFRDYMVSMLVKYVQTREGKPIDRQLAESWLALKGPLDAGWQKAVEKYGEKKLQKEIGDLCGRIVGKSLFGSCHKFDYTVTVPGLVVETNGVRLSDKKVRWQFTAAESFPHGYDMTCRSLAPCTGVQKAVLGGEVLTRAEQMQRFIALVEGDKGLLDALRECQARGGLRPLGVYRAALTARSDEAGVKRVDEVFSLLGRNKE